MNFFRCGDQQQSPERLNFGAIQTGSVNHNLGAEVAAFRIADIYILLSSAKESNWFSFSCSIGPHQDLQTWTLVSVSFFLLPNYCSGSPSADLG